MRRKEAKEQGHSLASHPRLDADRVGPHYEEPQFEQYSDDGEEYDEDDEQREEYRQMEADEGLLDGEEGDDTIQYEEGQQRAYQGGQQSEQKNETDNAKDRASAGAGGEDEELDELDLDNYDRRPLGFPPIHESNYGARHRTASFATVLVGSSPTRE
jgi:hypothetical protein